MFEIARTINKYERWFDVNMDSFYLIQGNEKPIKLEDFPFEDETEDLENFILANDKLIGNIILINRQIILPSKIRIDLWGIDFYEKKPVLIELKNVVIGLEILSQIMPYYDFMKNNPDSLKVKVLQDKTFESKIKELGYEEFKLDDFVKDDPKIYLIGSGFKQELIDVIDYLKFDIELIEIHRYKYKNQLFISINRPESKIKQPSTVSVMEEWNWKKYIEHGISENKINIAKELKENLDSIILQENIELKPIFRKLFIPYKYGRRNVILMNLDYTSWENGDIGIGFKLGEKLDLKKYNIDIHHTKTKSFEDYNDHFIFFDKIVDLTPLIPLIKKSFEYVTGQKIM